MYMQYGINNKNAVNVSLCSKSVNVKSFKLFKHPPNEIGAQCFNSVVPRFLITSTNGMLKISYKNSGKLYDKLCFSRQILFIGCLLQKLEIFGFFRYSSAQIRNSLYNFDCNVKVFIQPQYLSHQLIWYGVCMHMKLLEP